MKRQEGRAVTYLIAVIVVVLAIVGVLWTARTRAPEGETRGREEDLAPIAIGLNIWPGYGAFFIADEKGYFEEEGLSVDLRIIQGDPERQAAFVSGELQGIGMTLDTLAILRAQGVPAKAVYKYDGSSGADGIVAKNGVQEVADLQGKTVGYALGTPSHYLLAEALDRVGLETSDVVSRNLSADDAGSAFFAGQLDAAVTWEPWLSQAKTYPEGRLLLTTRELPVVEDVLFMDAEFLAESAASVRALLRACFRAVEYWEQHPEEGVGIIASRLGMESADVSEMLEGIAIQDLADNKAFFGTREAPGPAFKAYERVVELWMRDGVIDVPDSSTEAIDPDPVAALSIGDL